MIDPAFFGSLPDEAKLEAELALALAETRSYEDVLDAVRLFGQSHMFLIGARILSGSVSAEASGEVFARLADVLIRAMHRIVDDDFTAYQAMAVSAVRKRQSSRSAGLARGEMTANSDLDLIVIYDFDEKDPTSDGKIPLYGGQPFCSLDATPDQRTHGADQLRSLVSG